MMSAFCSMHQWEIVQLDSPDRPAWEPKNFKTHVYGPNSSDSFIARRAESIGGSMRGVGRRKKKSKKLPIFRAYKFFFYHKNIYGEIFFQPTDFTVLFPTHEAKLAERQ